MPVTITKFKPHFISVWGFAFADILNMYIFMILNDLYVIYLYNCTHKAFEKPYAYHECMFKICQWLHHTVSCNNSQMSTWHQTESKCDNKKTCSKNCGKTHTECNYNTKNKQKQTLWPLVRKRTIPTERPPLCRWNLVPTFADGGVSRGQSGGSSTAVNLSFLDRGRYFSFKYLLIHPHKGRVDPVSDTLLFRESGSVGNWTRDFCVSSHELLATRPQRRSTIIQMEVVIYAINLSYKSSP
jgi:hypothetical protein